MPWTCVQHSGSNTCKDWWKNTPGWQHATVILMCVALIIEIIALIWNIVTLWVCLLDPIKCRGLRLYLFKFHVILKLKQYFSFACCCKKYIIHPLTLFALVITICLTAGVIIYGVNNKDLFSEYFFISPVTSPLAENQPNIDTSLGWSFWMAVGAAVIALADIIVGAMTVCLGESGL